MRRDALQILKKIATHGEVSLLAAIKLGGKRFTDHRDQYPLALLIEAGYLGVTIDYTPPGGEISNEFAWAITLHMFALPSDPDGFIRYLGVQTSGSMDPERERVFVKAKGALYLDEQEQKFRDRMWSFVLGLAVGLLTAIAVSLLKKTLHLN